jgi:hypothetical protein
MVELIDVPDDVGEAFDAVYERGWTDGLPVIPPTPERVARMVEQSGRAAEEPIASVPPRFGEASVEAIAVNAVMAGCKPEYMPVLLAAVKAMCAPEFNLMGIQTTGDSVGPGAILNGPIRQTIDVNCAEGAAGPGNRANATIGRAIRLILMNVGGGAAGTTDRAMIGHPGKYAFCLGENEEHSPWEPFHVSRGFERDESTVTIVPVLQTQFAWPLVVDAETTLSSMVEAMAITGHSNPAYAAAPVTWIVPPANAGVLSRAGYSRRDVQQHLFEHARIPIERYPRSERDQMWAYEKDLVTEGDEVLVVADPQDILLVVAGGYDYSGAMYVGGWNARPVVEPVEVV